MSDVNPVERMEIMMPIEDIGGKYANFFRVGHSKTEFVLDFCFTEGPSNAHIVSRLIVSPINFKNFISAMKENIERYEADYNILLPENHEEFTEKGMVKKV